MARILIVEDADEVRRLFRRALKSFGYTFDVACDGEEAQDRVFKRRKPYDAILSDLLMPRQGGIEFLRAVSSEIHWTTPVIIVSGVDYLVEALGTLRYGACAILRKPVDLDELKEALAHAMEHRKVYREMKRLEQEAAQREERISELLRQVKASRERATIDPLTGLPNRARMFDDLAVFRENALRYQSRFAVAFVDVCDFGKFNAQYGTKVGDRVLREVARILGSAGRRGDVTYRPESGEVRPPDEDEQRRPTAFRFGGDEFVVVLAGQDHEGAARAARRLVEAVRTTPIPIDDEGNTVSMAISMGVAVNDPHHARSISQLLEAADRLLMKVKSARKHGEVDETLAIEPRGGEEAHAPAVLEA